MSWETLCEHAKEVPKVCPCPPTWGCKLHGCPITVVLPEIAPFNEGELLKLLGPSKPFKMKMKFIPEPTIDSIIKDLKVGSRFTLRFDLSDTHEMKVTARVTSKRRAKK